MKKIYERKLFKAYFLACFLHFPVPAYSNETKSCEKIASSFDFLKIKDNSYNDVVEPGDSLTFKFRELNSTSSSATGLIELEYAPARSLPDAKSKTLVTGKLYKEKDNVIFSVESINDMSPAKGKSTPVFLEIGGERLMSTMMATLKLYSALNASKNWSGPTILELGEVVNPTTILKMHSLELQSIENSQEINRKEYFRKTIFYSAVRSLATKLGRAVSSFEIRGGTMIPASSLMGGGETPTSREVEKFNSRSKRKMQESDNIFGAFDVRLRLE